MTRDVLGALGSQLPTAGERRIAVRATPDAVRHLRAGDPWLFDGSITSTSTGRSAGNVDGDSAATGDLAVVFDGNRRFVAIGLWDPGSPIRVKALHHGEPRPIDETFWRERISTALERRSTLAADPDTNAYRCVHGENDRLPSLVVDRYDRSLVVKLYSAIWFPHLAAVIPTLCDALDPERVVLRLSRAVGKGETFGLADGTTIVGPPSDGPVRFRERGLTLEADIVRGNKTGHFLDQRDNRALVRSMASGARVLDVFASTGGFSVAAAAGGATSVDLVDVSGPALRTAERNLAHNRFIAAVRACRVHTSTGDAFVEMERLRRREQRFDLVVVDPPSFAQRQADVPNALRSYARLTKSAVGLVEAGGALVQSSCSSRVTDDDFFTTVHEAAASAGVELSEIRRTGHPVDHPIGFEHGAYLKTLYARVEPARRRGPR
ncbi:MAG TPA: class I SAM-dependent rRNA methyltransferase [Ilumatobacteraceae bacterium]|nr:class I SAM-dependent rRNA methyltransferase [Ilumatobacteraceae bacterium]